MANRLTARRVFLQRGATWATTLGLGLHLGAGAQPATAPNSLRILCTAPGGSIPDIVARRYSEHLGGRYAGGVIVDNRGGAAGRIAVAALKQAAPDGATLLLAQGAVATVYPYLYDKLAYDPITDLKPVSVAAEAVLGLAVGPAVPESVTTLRQFVDWLRANPAQANYGSPGIGTLPHLMGALLAHEAQMSWTHVAYAGGPAALLDLMAGRLTALSLPEGLLRPHLAAGKLRVLATSGATRSSFLPNVASVAEQGFPKLVMREWFAFFMPGGTAQAMVDETSRALQQAAAQPALRASLADIGMLAVAGSANDMRERIAQEQPYWRGVIGATGIRAE